MTDQALDIAPGAIVEVRDEQWLVSAVGMRALSVSEPRPPFADVLTHEGHTVEMVLKPGRLRLRSHCCGPGVVDWNKSYRIVCRGVCGILAIAFRYMLERMQNEPRPRCVIIVSSFHYLIISNADICYTARIKSIALP